MNTLHAPISPDDEVLDKAPLTQEEQRKFALSILETQAFDFGCLGLKGRVLFEALQQFAEDQRFIGYTDEDLSRLAEYLPGQNDQPASTQPYSEAITSTLDSDDPIAVMRLAPIMATLTPLEWGILKAEIKQHFGKRINLNDLERSVNAERRLLKLKEEGEKKDIADIAHEWAMTHRDSWGYDREYEVFRCYNGECWEEQAKKHFLDEEAVAAIQTAGKDILSLAAINCFERLVEAKCLRDFTPTPGLVNFANGTLELSTMQLRGHRREDNLTYCIPYCYNPYGTHYNIDRFLAEVIPDEHARLALMAHGGLALLGDTFLHYFITLLGMPRCGKTTLLALLSALCGTYHPANLEDLFTFAGHSIFSRELEGKRSRYMWAQRRIVCVDELPAEALRDEEILKAMTAHSSTEMRGVNKDEKINNRWKPKLLMATNDQPRYKDTSSAVKERAVFIEITQARPKENRNPRLLVDMLLPELGSFAASCLELAMQALQRGYYPMSASMKRVLDRIENEGNSLKDFVLSRCALGKEVDGYKIPSDALHEAYKRFCEEQGYKGILATNTLSMQLRSMNIGIMPKSIRVGNRTERGLVGIRLRKDEELVTELIYTSDESLQKPARLLTNADNGESILNQTLKEVKLPGKPSEAEMLTVLTVKNSLCSYNSPLTPLVERKEKQLHSLLRGGPAPCAVSGTKTASIASTEDIQTPLEPQQDVDAKRGGSSTPVNRIREVL